MSLVQHTQNVTSLNHHTTPTWQQAALLWGADCVGDHGRVRTCEVDDFLGFPRLLARCPSPGKMRASGSPFNLHG